MEKNRKVNLLLLLDDTLFREGIKRIIESNSAYQVIGEGKNDVDGARLIEKYRPNIVMTDVVLPNENDVLTTKSIIGKFPEVRVMVFTNHDEESYVDYALNKGVQGYLLNKTNADALLEAIEIVGNGGFYIHPLVTHHLIKKYREAIHENAAVNMNRGVEYNKPLHLLTNRECEVLQLLAEGKSNRSISKEIYISENTVKNHIANILNKMKASDRTQAVVMAIRNGWVEIM